MDNLDAILRETISWYDSGGFSLKTFFMINAVENAYAVLITDVPVHKRPAGIVVFARIVGDYVVIEEDTTDRPLVDKLTARGIPREKIIRAYAGESLPEGLESPALP
jgi:hypothetical protein